MTRFVSGSNGAPVSASSANTLGATGVFGIKTALAVAANDLLGSGPDGLAYPVQTIDYAASANKGTKPVAVTAMGGGNSANYTRPRFVQHTNGDLYFWTPGGSGTAGQGVKLLRYNAAGTLLGSVNVDTFAAIPYDLKLHKLTNGNLLLTYSDGTQMRFAICDPALNIVAGPTTIGAVTGGDQWNESIALTGGGFMVLFHQSLTMKLGVYDNAGTVVTAVATIFTHTGASVNVSTRMRQMASGNVAVAMVSSYTGTTGLYVGALTPAGAIATAFAQKSAVSSNNPTMEMHSLGDTFAIAYLESGVGNQFMVFNYTCVQQGATLLAGTQLMGHRIFDDGTSYLLFYLEYATTTLRLWKVTTAGARTLNTLLAGVTPGGYSGIAVDAFVERGRVILGVSNAAQVPQVSVFNLATGILEAINIVTGFTDEANTGTLVMLPGGDFSAIVAAFNTPNNTYNLFCVLKYADTAVEGIATAATAAGAVAAVAVGAGAYNINPIKGTISKTFDHSATNIYGNRGTMMTNGVSLKGL